MSYKFEKDVLSEACWLDLNYDELKHLGSLLEAYEKCDPDAMPGVTGTKLNKLSPILKKVSDKLIDAKEIQLKLNKTIQEHFGESFISATGGLGTDVLELDHYKGTLDLILTLTIEEALTLYYYVALFTDEDIISKKLELYPGIRETTHKLVGIISKQLMRRIPEMIVFRK